MKLTLIVFGLLIMKASYGQVKQLDPIPQDFNPIIETIEFDKEDVNDDDVYITTGKSVGYYYGDEWRAHGKYIRTHMDDRDFKRVNIAEDKIIRQLLLDIDSRVKYENLNDFYSDIIGSNSKIEMNFKHGLPNGKITIKNADTGTLIFDGQLQQFTTAEGKISFRPIGKFSLWKSSSAKPMMVKTFDNEGRLIKTTKYGEDTGVILIKDESDIITRSRFYHNKNWFRSCESGPFEIRYVENSKNVIFLADKESYFNDMRVKTLKESLESSETIANLFQGNENTFITDKSFCQKIFDELKMEVKLAMKNMIDEFRLGSLDINSHLEGELKACQSEINEFNQKILRVDRKIEELDKQMAQKVASVSSSQLGILAMQLFNYNPVADMLEERDYQQFLKENFEGSKNKLQVKQEKIAAKIAQNEFLLKQFADECEICVAGLDASRGFTEKDLNLIENFDSEVAEFSKSAKHTTQIE